MPYVRSLLLCRMHALTRCSKGGCCTAAMALRITGAENPTLFLLLRTRASSGLTLGAR